MKRTIIFAWIVLAAAVAWGQRALSGEIEMRQALERLNTLGSAMMIGAHPDDENTALIAYLSRGRHVRMAYLALTRGEGGQNLIGPEQGDEMGIIRTQELLAARRIDGGEQFFTRAIDFGFSKTAQETLTKWPRDQVLGDIVWNIRRFRPDVIILRFTGTPRDGHGHHQTSAILGREAFTVAADPSKYPEQLQYVQTWQARRLMVNVNAANQQQQKEIEADAGRLEVDLGAYSPELGYSYGEIAGMSRSQHRSQGMGSAERKGAQKNYFQTLAGDRATKDIFEGIDIGWSRLPGGAAAGAVVKQALDTFVPARPEELLATLARARPLLVPIKDPLAERRLYLSMIGLLFIVLEFLRRVDVRQPKWMAGLAGVLVVAGIATYQRNIVWSDPVVLWEDTVAKSPQIARDEFQLAEAYRERGDCGKALGHYARSAQLDSSDDTLFVDWGLAYDCLNQPDQAIAKLRQAANMKATAHVYSQIGMIFGKQGRNTEALAALATAEELSPRFEWTYDYRGRVYLKMGNPEAAVREFRRALAINPRNQPANEGLAMAEARLRQR